MEKLLSDDEKIRKAEEIYFRRNNQDYNNHIEKGKTSIKDRFFLHLLIMLDIAIVVFCIQNKEFIFTKEFLNKINEYNINISSNVTNQIKKILKDNREEINNDDIINSSSNSLYLNVNSDSLIKNDELVEEKNNTLVNNNAPEETEKNEDNIGINNSILCDDDLDIQNLKSAYSFINPIKGVITSRFGIRNSENKNIDGYHTGIDIASDKGTLICASMQWIVDEVSSVGDYGNHIKIRCNNITTLYAHCDNIYVNKDQIVAEGQTIGTVGSTGNSTGPHLHFEIRIDDRFINPEKILDIWVS